MKFQTSTVEAKGIRLSWAQDGIEVGRASVYFIHNDLHDQPFALEAV